MVDTVGVDGVGDELFGELGRFSGSDEPTHDVAGVDVEDRVELEPGPFVGSGEFGDVPAPYLVGSGGDEFGFDQCRAACLGSAFPDLMSFS